MKYISDGTWFDADTEVKVVDDYRPHMNAGVFEGYRNGVLDQEVCSFDEFDAMDKSGKVVQTSIFRELQ